MKNFLKQKLGLYDDIYQLKKEDLQRLDQYLDQCREVAKSLEEIKYNDLHHVLRNTFIKKLCDKLNKDGENWEYHHGDGKHCKYTNYPCFMYAKLLGKKELWVFIPSDRGHFNVGVNLDKKADGNGTREMMEKFKDKDVKMFASRWWTHLPYSAYGEHSDLAQNFHDDKWNILFIEKTDELVELFYKGIEKVRIAWDKICEEEERQSV